MLSPSIVTPNDTPKRTGLGAAPPKRFATESFVIGACAPFAWPGRRSGDVNCTDMIRWIYGICTYIYIYFSLLRITCVYMNKYIYIISIYPSIDLSLSLSPSPSRYLCFLHIDQGSKNGPNPGTAFGLGLGFAAGSRNLMGSTASVGILDEYEIQMGCSWDMNGTMWGPQDS